MTAKMFIKVSDIKGDATDRDHEDWIVIQNMAFGMERYVDMNERGAAGRAHAKNEFQKIEVTSLLGTASNELAEAVAKGTVHMKIELHVCRTSERESDSLKPYSIWTFKNAIIDRYYVSFSEDGVPEESWRIAYVEVKHEFMKTDESSGKQARVNEFSWNRRMDKSA